MSQQREAREVTPDGDLLTLARQLRDAAARAGRTDVAAKADEVIALIGTDPAGDAKSDRGNTVIRILDGLGF